VVEAGEFVYYPANYWHQTENQAPLNIAFSSSIADDNNYKLVMYVLCAVPTWPEGAEPSTSPFQFLFVVCAQGGAEKRVFASEVQMAVLFGPVQVPGDAVQVVGRPLRPGTRAHHLLSGRASLTKTLALLSALI
jgi:hypothetical protein